jgi:hypothetical protein
MRTDDGWEHDPRDAPEVKRQPSDGGVKDCRIRALLPLVFRRRNPEGRGIHGILIDLL